jgi:hypothetical protein
MLQNGLIKTRIAATASRLNCQNIFFFKLEDILFLSNSDRDLYCENSNVSQVSQKYKKIKIKNPTTIVKSKIF